MEGLQNKRTRVDDTDQKDGSDVIILLDESGSMEDQEQSIIPAVQQALCSLARMVPSPNELSVKVFCFADEMRLVCDNTLGAIDEMRMLTKEGVAYSPHGTTSLYDAILEGLEHCASHATLLVATDGENTTGHHTQETARKALAKAQQGPRRIKVIWLAEGSGAALEGKALGLDVRTDCEHMSLSQALAAPEIHAQLSQSVAME
jgi:uncharacterized protein with von Willebrand factor type A (vWA) domain